MIGIGTEMGFTYPCIVKGFYLEGNFEYGFGSVNTIAEYKEGGGLTGEKIDYLHVCEEKAWEIINSLDLPIEAKRQLGEKGCYLCPENPPHSSWWHGKSIAKLKSAMP